MSFALEWLIGGLFVRFLRPLDWGRIMTEVDFVNRFRREPAGSWTCKQPIKISGPDGPLFITQGQCFSPGFLFLGIDLARELDRMASIRRSVELAHKIARVA